jgi:HK97 family phage major capsid protein
MALDKKDLDTVTEALSAKFNEMKDTNDKELSAVKSELKGEAEKFAHQVKELQALKDEIDESLKQKGRIGGNHGKDVDEHKDAFIKFVKSGRDDGLQELELKALNLGAGEDGGFAVPEQLDTDISGTLRDLNVMRQAANVITIGGAEYKKLFNVHGAASGWVGETDERTATDAPKLKEITPFMGEIYANPQATQRMLDDVFFNAESWLAAELAEEFAEQEEVAFTTGNGTNKPKGFLAYTSTDEADASRAFGSLQHKLAAGTTVFTADEIKLMPFMLRAKYRKGAAFMGNGNTLAQIMLLKNTQGDYIWRPGLDEGVPALLAGYKYLENETMPDQAANAKALAFGNFKRGYTIVDRMGTRVLRDPLTNKPYVGFYTTKRVGGMVADSNAIKLMQMAAA